MITEEGSQKRRKVQKTGKGKEKMEEEEEDDEDEEAEWREEVSGRLVGLEKMGERILKELAEMQKTDGKRFQWVKAIYDELEEDRKERIRFEVEVKEGLRKLNEYLESETEGSE